MANILVPQSLVSALDMFFMFMSDQAQSPFQSISNVIKMSTTPGRWSVSEDRRSSVDYVSIYLASNELAVAVQGIMDELHKYQGMTPAPMTKHVAVQLPKFEGNMVSVDEAKHAVKLQAFKAATEALASIANSFEFAKVYTEAFGNNFYAWMAELKWRCKEKMNALNQFRATGPIPNVVKKEFKIPRALDVYLNTTIASCCHVQGEVYKTLVPDEGRTIEVLGILVDARVSKLKAMRTRRGIKTVPVHHHYPREIPKFPDVDMISVPEASHLNRMEICTGLHRNFAWLGDMLEVEGNPYGDRKVYGYVGFDGSEIGQFISSTPSLDKQDFSEPLIVGAQKIMAEMAGYGFIPSPDDAPVTPARQTKMRMSDLQPIINRCVKAYNTVQPLVTAMGMDSWSSGSITPTDSIMYGIVNLFTSLRNLKKMYPSFVPSPTVQPVVSFEPFTEVTLPEIKAVGMLHKFEDNGVMFAYITSATAFAMGTNSGFIDYILRDTPRRVGLPLDITPEQLTAKVYEVKDQIAQYTAYGNAQAAAKVAAKASAVSASPDPAVKAAQESAARTAAIIAQQAVAMGLPATATVAEMYAEGVKQMQAKAAKAK